MKRLAIRLLLGLLPWQACLAENVTFDADYLRMLGISSQVAESFATGNRFASGLTPVDITLNDSPVGTHTARFDDAGELCAGDDFLAALGLRADKDAGSATCPRFSDRFNQASVTLDPGVQQVHLVVPAASLAQPGARAQSWTRGGTAAMLNYRLSSLRSVSGARQSWDYANLEAGINWQNWAVRHASAISDENGQLRYDRNWLYARRVLEPLGQQLQVGEINLATPLVSGGPITGMQLIPWSPLQPTHSDSAIDGYASSNPSRVEVFQSGKLIYATRVPAGPFSLTDVPLLNRTSDIQLRVTGSDGSQRESRLTPADYLNRQSAPSGWQFAFGQMRSAPQQPWLVSGSRAFTLNRQTTLALAALATPRYGNAALGINLTPWQSVQLNSQLASSLAADKTAGSQSQTQANWQLPAGVALSSGYSLSSAGYHGVAEQPVRQRREVISEGVSWQHPLTGALSTRLSQSHEGPCRAHSLNLSWQRQIAEASVTMSWQDDHRTSPLHHADHNEQSLWLNLSLPLAGHTLSGFYRQDRESHQQGVSAAGDLAPQTRYSLTVEHDRDSQSRMSGDMQSNLHLTSATLGASSDGHLSGSLSGAVVAHQNGVTFSPYPVGETFAVARLEPAVSGIQIDTPAGPVWSDRWGQAVIAETGSYQPGVVELNTETLPHNIDVDNGTRQMNYGFATVAQLRFRMINNRGALMHVLLADGRPLPKGSAVLTPSGRFITTAVDEGTVYVPNVEDTPQLNAHWDAGAARQCRMHWSLPAEQNAALPFETVTATCL